MHVNVAVLLWRVVKKILAQLFARSLFRGATHTQQQAQQEQEQQEQQQHIHGVAPRGGRPEIFPAVPALGTRWTNQTRPKGSYT